MARVFLISSSNSDNSNSLIGMSDLRGVKYNRDSRSLGEVRRRKNKGRRLQSLPETLEWPSVRAFHARLWRRMSVLFRVSPANPPGERPCCPHCVACLLSERAGVRDFFGK